MDIQPARLFDEPLMREWLLAGPADATFLRLARLAVRQRGEQLGLPATRCHDAEIGLVEAIANVVLHAYGADDGTKPIEVRIGEDGVVLVIVVADFGNGLTGFSRNPDGGRGLLLMHALADGATVASDGGGTEVRLRFTAAGVA